MNLERIAMIRNHLRDNVQDVDFNLQNWGGDWGRPFDPNNFGSCGTVACAVGHSTNIPEFQALGFKLVANSSLSSPRAHICWEGYGGWDAVEQFLELSHVNAEYLFYSGSYLNVHQTTRQEVVDRLTGFLSEYSHVG